MTTRGRAQAAMGRANSLRAATPGAVGCLAILLSFLYACPGYAQGRGAAGGLKGASKTESTNQVPQAGPALLSVVIEVEREKSSVKPPEDFDEGAEVAAMARAISMQNPAEQKMNPVKFVQDAYAQMAKDPLFKDLPSAMVAPYSAASGHPCHYFLFLPEGYGEPVPAGGKEIKKWPLLVFLHGSGGNMKLAPWTMLPVIRKQGYIAVFPSYLNGTWWTPVGGKFFRKVLSDVSQRYPIDRSRVIICGVSNGATGAWAISRSNSTEFRGVVSISGAFDGQESMMATRGPPVYIVHGALDGVIHVKFSRAASKALSHNRPGTVYKEFPEDGHLIFFSKGTEIMTGVFEWAEKLPPYPPGRKAE